MEEMKGFLESQSRILRNGGEMDLEEEQVREFVRWFLPVERFVEEEGKEVSISREQFVKHFCKELKERKRL